MAKLGMTVVLGGALFVSVAAGRIPASHDTVAAPCRVSKMSHPVPGRPSFTVGNARIAVALPDPARFVAIPDGSPRGGRAFIQRDGWIRTKLGWFSARGTPRVTGRRVDGHGRALRADVGALSFTSNGSFYPSLLYFPTFGCWRIAAAAGGARLSAVVDVTR